jgi:signal transduction histidine kinase
VTAVDDQVLAQGLGRSPLPADGDTVGYELRSGELRSGTAGAPDVAALVRRSAGDIVFVIAFGLLALALYSRRPTEPAVGPLLIAAAALFGSTLCVAAGLPVLALAVGGPPVWTYLTSTVAIYSLAWGAVIATSLVFVPGHPWLSRRPRVVLGTAYLAPPAAMGIWTASVSATQADPLRVLGLLDSGQAVVTALALLTGVVAGVVAYRHTERPVDRARLRWVAGGGAVATLTGIAVWTVPTLLRGQPLLAPGAFGLSGLPFVAGVGVALRRHQLFAIERLVNRSLVYSAVLALLAAGYALLVTALVSGLRLSGTLAAGLAAAAAALAILPVRSRAQRAVNHLMYGQRDEPAGVLAELGERLQAVLLPADVAAVTVETIARSLRVPYVGLDIVDADGGLYLVAKHGTERDPMHTEPLLHHGAVVGRLRVAGRGPDDPLDDADLSLVGSLARQVGPAVQAVRLHADLVRARAAVVTLREEERRRLRRDLHDGIGPVLATIALKAGLAARTVPDGPAKDLLGQIGTEVADGLGDVRRLAEELRPPVIDELGLVGALRRRAEALSGALVVEVDAPQERLTLPAAIESAAYGIAVEAMTNAVRHSNGSRCTVSLAVTETDLVLVVHDNGSGPAAVRPPGVGLRSMRERADELGGRCDVRFTDAGTEVAARLPLSPGGLS